MAEKDAESWTFVIFDGGKVWKIVFAIFYG